MSARTPAGWRRGGWVIGAVAGIALGVLAGLGTQAWQEDRQAADLAQRDRVLGEGKDVPPPVDAVRALLEQSESRVAVDPRLADRVDETQLAQAREALAGATPPRHLAYLRYPDSLDEGYTNSGAAAQWAAAIGETGHYVVVYDNGSKQVASIGLEDEYLDANTRGQPGPALVRAAEELATWPATPEQPPRGPSENDYWGGIAGGIGAGVLFGALGVLPLFALVRWLVGRPRGQGAGGST